MFSTRQRRSAWLVALAVAGALGSAMLAHERHYEAAQDAVHETLAIQQAIADALSTLKDAETGQRGFLLTGDPSFLTPYLRDPEFITPGLDPTAVRRIGVFFFGEASSQLYVDQISAANPRSALQPSKADAATGVRCALRDAKVVIGKRGVTHALEITIGQRLTTP